MRATPTSTTDADTATNSAAGGSSNGVETASLTHEGVAMRHSKRQAKQDSPATAAPPPRIVQLPPRSPAAAAGATAGVSTRAIATGSGSGYDSDDADGDQTTAARPGSAAAAAAAFGAGVGVGSQKSLATSMAATPRDLLTLHQDELKRASVGVPDDVLGLNELQNTHNEWWRDTRKAENRRLTHHERLVRAALYA